MPSADADRTLLSAWESTTHLPELSLLAAEALHMGTSVGRAVYGCRELTAAGVEPTEPMSNGTTADATPETRLAYDCSDFGLAEQAYAVEVLSPTGVWRRCTILRTARPPEQPEEAIIVRYDGFPAQYDESIASREWPYRLRLPVRD